MKQKIIFILLFVFLGVILGYVCVTGYHSYKMQAANTDSSRISYNGQAQTSSSGSIISSVTEDEEEDSRMWKQESIARIDYPLIDLYFEKDKTYKIVIKKYMSDTIVDEYKDKGDFFQYNKEYISILTIPSGRGTTPPFMFEIYEEDKLIKNMDCFEVRPGILDDRWKSE